jgi:A-factor type gamma-butyrolactone 1'-reductase (1S-forming)
MEFHGKSIMITGAASGIGEACARRAAQCGAALMLCDIDVEQGEALCAELVSQGVDCHFHVCNVTAERDIETAVRKAVKLFGQLDCAINNAGITGLPAPLEDTTLEAWNEVIGVNLTSVFLCLKYQLRTMKARGRGAIVNISSGAGLIGTPNLVS